MISSCASIPSVAQNVTFRTYTYHNVIMTILIFNVPDPRLNMCKNSTGGGGGASTRGAQLMDDFLTPSRLLPTHPIAPSTSSPYRLRLHAKILVDVEGER